MFSFSPTRGLGLVKLVIFDGVTSILNHPKKKAIPTTSLFM